MLKICTLEKLYNVARKVCIKLQTRTFHAFFLYFFYTHTSLECNIYT